MTNLPERMAKFRAEIESGKPPYNFTPQINETMHRATAELTASGQVERAKKVGDKMPQFVLNDADGNAVNTAELLKHGPLILTFYRGFWCPYCNMELQALEEVLPEIRNYGATLVALSPQKAVSSRRAARDNKVTFPILEDAKGEVAHKFGLRFALPGYLVELYASFGNDLPATNDDPSWTLSIPARYIIGQDGIIAYSAINADYTNRPEPAEMMPILKELTMGHSKAKTQS